MWVKLRSIQRLSKHGQITTYHPGDWAEVPDQEAKRLIAAGQAWVPAGTDTLLVPPNAGVVVRGDGEYGWLKAHYSTLPIQPGPVDTPYVYNAIWHTHVPLRPELLVIGFHLLNRWDIAVPLLSYDKMARDIGSEKDRKATEAVILDLRVPLYNTELIFVRGTGAGKVIMNAWRASLSEGDERLAFLRALWAVKPRICALPDTWSMKEAPRESIR